MNEAVLYAVGDGVATITLNRPKVLNALDGPMAEGLAEALYAAERDAGVRAVLLAGAGGGFMAGGDIKTFHGWLETPKAEISGRFERLIHAFHQTLILMRRLPKPIVARVHGPVAGAGMSLLMACDLAVAAEDAFFTLAYCHLGTSPDGGSTWFLPRHVGMKKAAEIALLGGRFGAAEALSLGFVNAVVPASELEARAAALAQRLAAGPRAAYAATKRLLQQSVNTSFESQLQAEAEAFAGCTATDDFAEGVRAFIEKRPPRFGAGDR
jgi:2-(1,2-epoxy-1,2-dihydrophenyl)acetyl-CoA isomerase